MKLDMDCRRCNLVRLSGVLLAENSIDALVGKPWFLLTKRSSSYPWLGSDGLSVRDSPSKAESVSCTENADRYEEPHAHRKQLAAGAVKMSHPRHVPIP